MERIFLVRITSHNMLCKLRFTKLFYQQSVSAFTNEHLSRICMFLTPLGRKEEWLSVHYVRITRLSRHSIKCLRGE